MLRVQPLWQRSCQLIFESVGGPDPTLNPAELLCENVWTRALAGFPGFDFAHARLLAGEQLQHSEQ